METELDNHMILLFEYERFSIYFIGYSFIIPDPISFNRMRKIVPNSKLRSVGLAELLT
jgi:hypothetical protein